MSKLTALFLGLALVCSILLVGVTSVQGLTSSQVKTAVNNAIDNKVNGDWSKIKLVIIRESGQARVTVYNTTSVIPTPPPIPPVPPTPIPSVIPKLDITKTVRVGIVGDIDNNNGLVTQLNLMKKHQVQILVVPGDYAYKDGAAVLSKITNAGFTKTNTVLVVGNHDKCSEVKAWLSIAACYGDKFFSNAKIAFHSIDGNSDFSCSGTQFNTVKSDIESSDAWYNFAVVHQPFVTVSSDHGPNGKFACFQTIFKANGVSAVLQAHNHNYQTVTIDGVHYGVYGTGTHDTGSSMYDCDSSSFNGHPVKCITGTNGVTIMDIKIDNPLLRQINGYFLSNSEKVIDTFVLNK